MANENLLQLENLEVEILDDGELNLSFDLNAADVGDENRYYEYYVQFLRDGNVVKTTHQNIERVAKGDESFNVWFSENFLNENKPDSFQLFYRSFQLGQSIEIQLENPPELNKKSGSFNLCSPKKSMLGGGAWKTKTIEVESIVLQLKGQELNYFLNLNCAKPYDSLFEVMGNNGQDETINYPQIIEAPFFTLGPESIDAGGSLNLVVRDFLAEKWVKSMPVMNLGSSASEKSDVEAGSNNSEIGSKKISKNKKGKIEKERKLGSASEMADDFFKHNVMLVSIGKSMSEKDKIYDAARWEWKASLTRAETCQYVIAHSSGKIVGVFKPSEWLASDDEVFSELGKASEGRIGFVGEVAEPEVLLEYLNKEIPKSYFPKGAANPVRFIEKKDTAQLKLSKIYRIAVSQDEELLVNMVYAEIGGDNYEVFGAFSGQGAGGGLFYQNSDGEMLVSDDPGEFDANISPDSVEETCRELERLRAEYEEFDDDGEILGFSEIGLKFIDTGKDENGYVEAYSDGASDDFIYDVQDDWNLNFYKD